MTQLGIGPSIYARNKEAIKFVIHYVFSGMRPTILDIMNGYFFYQKNKILLIMKIRSRSHEKRELSEVITK